MTMPCLDYCIGQRLYQFVQLRQSLADKWLLVYCLLQLRTPPLSIFFPKYYRMAEEVDPLSEPTRIGWVLWCPVLSAYSGSAGPINIMQTEAKQQRSNFEALRGKMKKQGLVPHLSISEPSASHSLPDLPLVASTSLPDMATPLTSHRKTFEEDFEVKEKVGEGANGVVRRCVERSTGIEYVVKVSQIDEEHVIHLRKTFNVMRRLSHPCVVKYRAMYLKLSQNKCYLVMEYVPFPSLRKFRDLPESKIKNIAKQLLETIQYLHSQKLCHRDLKLDNILYEELEEKICVIDFGISKAFEDSKRKGMLTNTGTIYYKAPEIFEGGGYNQSVDLWAAGVIIYELFTGHTPFESEFISDTIARILDVDYSFSEKWMKISKLAKDLVARLLKKKNGRLTAEEALKSPWMLSHRKKSGADLLLMNSGTFAFGYDDEKTHAEEDDYEQFPWVTTSSLAGSVQLVKRNVSAANSQGESKATVKQLQSKDDEDIFSS